MEQVAFKPLDIVYVQLTQNKWVKARFFFEKDGFCTVRGFSNGNKMVVPVACVKKI
jgi:hypothetical protein